MHASYDARAAHRFWRALVQADRVFKLFRSGFLGKASPGAFLLGQLRPRGDALLRTTRAAASRRRAGPAGRRDPRSLFARGVSSAGFWPGSDAFPQAAFYSYAYPEPPGFREAAVTPECDFRRDLGEFILPYETVRVAADPDALLLDFLVTTYAAAADAGDWDRAALECEIGAPARPRPL